MKKIVSIIVLTGLMFSLTAVYGQEFSARPEMYGVANWDADSLGNHRAVIRVETKADVVLSHIPWRRRDTNPENKGIIIIDAATGKQIRNVLPLNINREFGDILFQPETAPGEYYVYYLKYYSAGRSNYPKITYPPFIPLASEDWTIKAKETANNLKELPATKLVQFQAIDDFNTFYPMGIIATKNEVEKIIKQNPKSEYLTFTESRENSIQMTTDLPAKWIADGPKNSFSGKAIKGEYFTFQIGIYPVKEDIEDIKIVFEGLKSFGKEAVLPNAFTCFNLEGTDWEGKPFTKRCSVEKGKVQPLWIGVQVPDTIEPGDYEGKLKIKPRNLAETAIQVKLQIGGGTIESEGDNNPYNMSRLRWLNSSLGIDDNIVKPYTQLEVSDKSISCLGRKVDLDDSGFPTNILSYFSGSVTKIIPNGKEVLSSPIRLVVERDNKMLKWESRPIRFMKKEVGTVAWEMESATSGLKLTGKAQMEFDGNIDYQLILTAETDITVDDIRLEIPFNTDAAKYMMGLGQKGGFRPESVNWKWKVENNQDGPWIGDVNAGLQARFRDNHYSRPLNTNFYLSKPLYMPDSWDNNGKGGITINAKNSSTVLLTSYSGRRAIKKGEQLHFYFNLLITPFHTIDTQKHWHNRFYHSYKPIKEITQYGANTINVHHANEINPFINYPFLRPEMMKSYIDSAHAEGLKVKIYYTVRELSNKAPELFMLRSLGDEVLSHGKGGGFSWLQEHLDSNYIAAWFVPELRDAAIVNTGISRWHNYYVEGLNWLVKNIGIDGLYIDDIAFDRTTMKRVRKILDTGNPGALIDVHSANQFNPRDGFANSANLYLEHFPYIDRLWFGEYFDYDSPPDFWLIETSGIPFGLMGEMLEKGGNPWRGMVFGMTARAPWSGNPAPLWKFWDDFGIQQSEMIGYWDVLCPISGNNKNVRASVYLKKDEALIAVANWEPTDSSVKLDIDISKLGFKPKSLVAKVLSIDSFQPELEFDLDRPITIPGGKGYLLIVK